AIPSELIIFAFTLINVCIRNPTLIQSPGRLRPLSEAFGVGDGNQVGAEPLERSSINSGRGEKAHFLRRRANTMQISVVHFAANDISADPGALLVPSSVETEIKFELPPSEVAKLNKLAPLRVAKAAKPASQVSIYFDTGKFALRKKGVMLRVRRTGRRYVQTIKATGNGLLDRKEWENEIKGRKPDFAAAEDTALAPLLTKK